MEGSSFSPLNFSQIFVTHIDPKYQSRCTIFPTERVQFYPEPARLAWKAQNHVMLMQKRCAGKDRGEISRRKAVLRAQLPCAYRRSRPRANVSQACWHSSSPRVVGGLCLARNIDHGPEKLSTAKACLQARRKGVKWGRRWRGRTEGQAGWKEGATESTQITQPGRITNEARRMKESGK